MKTAKVLVLSLPILAVLVLGYFHCPTWPAQVDQRIRTPAKSDRPIHVASNTETRSRASTASLTERVAALESAANAELRDDALEQLAESVPASDLPGALNGLLGDAGKVGAELRTRLVRRWAELNPPAARQWCADLPEGPARRQALADIAIVEANRDLADAAAWVMGLPNDASGQAAKAGVAYEAARTDPIQALDLASTLPATPQRDELLVHAASQWAAANFTNAAAWALNVTDPDLRDRLVGAVAVGSAEQNPEASAMLAAQALPPGDGQDRAVVSIVQRWAVHSPQETADWVSQFPQTPAREAAVKQLLSVWVNHEPQQAQEWLNNLPPGKLRATGLMAYDQAIARPQ